MKGEPVGQNPGIVEYKSRGGITVRLHANPSMEENWDLYTHRTTMTREQSRSTAASLLTRPFLEKTLGSMGTDLTSSECDIVQIQMGLRNVIYRVDVADAPPFVLVMSKGTPTLNRETETDFTNLTQLRKGLIERHFDPFVPETYAVTNNGKISGFSFEFLPDHLELSTMGLAYIDPRSLQTNSTYTTFVALTDSPRGDKFNQTDAHRNAIEGAKAPTSPLNPNFLIKEQLVIHLVLMYFVADARPRNFAINAGDFMFNPDKPDFDLKLITVRGGWKKIGMQEFVQWLYDHQEYLRAGASENAVRHYYPLFDRNMDILRRGIERANAISAAAKGQ